MSDLQREESFRSAIKNQKRRLSATKIEKRNSLTDTGKCQKMLHFYTLLFSQCVQRKTNLKLEARTPLRCRLG
jgi:hypothetical protein